MRVSAPPFGPPRFDVRWLREMRSADQEKAMTSDKGTKSETTSKPASNPDKAAPKVEGSTYSRGENQKPVNESYTDNWNSIFNKKKKKKRSKR
jgi:hypothetical protein